MKANPRQVPDTSVILRIGDAGPDVQYLQACLRSQGYYQDAPDGIFGPRTEASLVYFQQTHTGPDKKFLTDSGEIGRTGLSTWWALTNPSGEAQRSYLDPRIPKGLPPGRVAILKTAMHDHRTGVKEIPDGANFGDGVSKYLVGIGPAYWCCYAVSYWCREATGAWPLGERFGLCLALWTRAKELNRTYQRDPVPGDVFVILYRNHEGDLTGAGHVGLVAATSKDGQQFCTLEGNAGNRVKAGLRSCPANLLVGFVDLFGDHQEAREHYRRGLFRISDEVTSSVKGTR